MLLCYVVPRDALVAAVVEQLMSGPIEWGTRDVTDDDGG
jgi:hypothetical protein